jgi:predicted RNA binding protein YcfA (HicA-like mRNA interferase family)
VAKKAIDESLRKVLSGRGNLSFRELEVLLRRLGFSLDRVRGSHRIYSHPKLVRPFPVQPAGGDAKRYQVRELRDIIVRHRLQIGKDE